MEVASLVPATPASLYVGDLQQDVTDAQLFDAFSEFKSLASVRVCRDSSTGRSLCYGYVNFISLQDAIQCIEVKNHSTLNGKAIRVMWSHRDPDARRSGIGNVFVKNLSDSIDSVKVQEMFQKFGNVLSCKVATSDDGKSKGYGFVQFDSENSANAAIENLNGSIVGDKQIYVGKFVKKSERAVTNPEAKYTNLYVKNLDPDVTEELLMEKFSEYGKIISLAILKDENGASRGFGFVNFENPDNAKRALEAFHGTQLGSKVLYVARAQKKAEREEILRRQFEEKRREKILKYQASNVYVKNIDDDVTDDELRDHFSQCGTITSVKLMRDDKGMSKGFGFVCFSTPEEAIKAVNTFHGFMLHRKPLYAAIAQRKEERQAQLQLQYAHRIAGLVGPSAVIPGGYPTLYYPSPGVVSQVPAQPGLMYQPLGMRPGWRANGFADPSRPAFQPSPVPLIPNNPRPNRQNRGRMNGHVLPQGGGPTYPSHLQQPTQSMVFSNDPSKHQHAGHVKYVPNGRSREMSKGSPVPIADGSGAEGSEMLSSQLAAAPPEQQKQMLGERLYPLVSQHKPDLAAKITGMLLEMDNSELLLLLESPESLAAKVEEAVQVLELSKAKVSSQDAIHSNYLSAQVAVN
ncbi:Polyadenylate-binding protein 7 [Abeliophyllum distichum]|uniref:Polyadenylate-binding protein n=1 Tax=Abeliophyllum distichum TaxID=126358 RepID=A0ABD1QZN9_9LAMI